MSNDSHTRLNTLLTVMTAVTGLTLEDLAAETVGSQEERDRAKGLNIRKMTAHPRGVSIEEVPDFMRYPETGFPPEQQPQVCANCGRSYESHVETGGNCPSPGGSGHYVPSRL